jgi:hypothetical protein
LRNNLIDLVDANEDTFDATVSPAIFTLQKRDSKSSFSFNYIDGAKTDIQEYRSFVSELKPVDLGNEIVKRIELMKSTQGYRVKNQLYRDTFRSAIFEPTQANLRLHNQFMSRVRDVAEKWDSELRDVKTLKKNIDRVKQDHINQLSPGEITILGLLTIGGVGLQADKNAKRMAFLQGTEEAKELAERNPNFELNKRNENSYKYLDRVITEDRIADPSELSRDEQLNGIPNSQDKTWVPIEKGFKQSDLYYKPQAIYINWSRKSLDKIREHRYGILKNIEYYFQPGVFNSRGGFANLQARYTNNRAIDQTGNIFVPINSEVISVKYLVGILNSAIPIHITENFINSTGMETSDLRSIPIPIPNKEEEKKIEALVTEAIKAQKGEESRSLDTIHEEIKKSVNEIYKVDLDG